MRKHGIIITGIGIALALGIGACGGKAAVHPTTTSTPPAVSAPSAPVPDSSPAPAPSAPAPDSSTAPTDDVNAPLTAKIGETFNATMTDGSDVISRADVTVNKMTDLGATIEPADEYSSADHATKGRFVVFTITYADTTGAFDYNEFDWSVRMPDGQVFGSAVVMNDLSRFGQPLNSGTMHEGQRAKGILTFDIPRTHGTLVYTLDSISGQSAEIAF